MKTWFAALLVILSPEAVAATAEELAGSWVAQPVFAGQRGEIRLRLSPEADGQLSVRLALPPIGARDIALGPATVESDRVVTGLGAFVYESETDTLSGTLPEALVPVHRIPVIFRRTERLEPAPEPGNFGRIVVPDWTFTTGAPVYGSPLVDKGIVYTGSDDGFIYALDARSGGLRWKVETKGPVRARPALAGDRLYVPSDDGNLYCLAARDGKLQWKRAIGSAPAPRSVPGSEGYRYDHFSSAVRVGNDSLFVGTLDGDLLAVDPGSGEEKWRFSAAGPILSTPAVRDHAVFFGSFDQHVYSLDAGTGELNWKIDTGAPVVSSPAVFDDLVVIGSRSYDLFGLDADDGSVRWQFYIWFSWVESSAVVADGVVYIGSSDAGMVFAIDAATGEQVWSFDSAGSPWATPAVTADRVFIGSVGVRGYFIPHKPGFYALDRSTGEPVWWYPTVHPENEAVAGFVSSPMADDERVYVGGLDGKVYAFPVRP